MSTRTMPPAEARFAAELAVARTRAGLARDKVAGLMVEAGFGTFRGSTVAQIEQGKRGTGLGEAIELARITGLDLAEFVSAAVS